MLQNTYTKCITNSLSNREAQTSFTELCKTTLTTDNASLSFLLHLLDNSISHTINRRGRRRSEKDVTIKQAIENEEIEETMDDDQSDEESDPSEEEVETTRSGRRARKVNYAENKVHKHESDEEPEITVTTSGRVTRKPRYTDKDIEGFLLYGQLISFFE